MRAVACECSTDVREIDPVRCADWERVVGAFSEANVFHRAAWAHTLQSAYGFRPCYLVEGGVDAPVSVLPLMEVRSWATGARGVSLPFTDRVEPLVRDAGAPARLFNAAVALARQRHWGYIEWRGGGVSRPDAEVATRYFGHHLCLHRELSSIRKAVHESTRRSIRKAEHAEVAVTFACDIDAMKRFYRLHCMTRRRHGVPPQPWTFFEALQTFVVSTRGAVVLAYHQGAPIAGAVFLHDGDTAMYKYGASDYRFQHLRAANLVMWRAIERFQGQGIRTLDFGRTSSNNAGLRRFKLSWGASESCIDYFRYCLRTLAFIRVADRSTGWHSRLFRLLPTPVARWCGELLYPHVA